MFIYKIEIFRIKFNIRMLFLFWLIFVDDVLKFMEKGFFFFVLGSVRFLLGYVMI